MDMNIRNLVDVSPFLLFEATADSDQPDVRSFDGHDHDSAFMDYAIDQQHRDDDDDAESCSCNVSDRSSISCVSDDFHFNGCDLDLDLDDGNDDDDETVVEVDEGEIFWPGYENVESEKKSCVDSDSSKEVMVMNEMEKSRLFWETCLAS